MSKPLPTEPVFCQQCVDKARELAGHQIRAEEFYAERQNALAEIDRYRTALREMALIAQEALEESA